MPIGGLNRSSSKTNCRRIKLSSLEAPANTVLASRFKLWQFRQYFFLNLLLLFFLLLFFLSIKNFFIRHKNSKTTKPRNSKFGNTVSPYAKLCTCIFGGATSLGLRADVPKTCDNEVYTDLKIDFRHVYCIKRWSRGHNFRDQGQSQELKKNPKPRTEFSRKDSLEAKDRTVQGQGQKPNTQFFWIMVGKFFIIFKRENS